MVTNETLKEIVTLLCSENTAKKKYIFELIDEDECQQEQAFKEMQKQIEKDL